MDQLVTLLSARTDTSNDSQIIESSISAKDQLLADWVYAANSSNQGKYGTFTLALVTLLEIPGFPKDVANSIAKSIISQELKVIYRALTLLRQAQTIPTLNLLKCFAILAPNELHQDFDFTLRAIPKLLGQQPFRPSFLEFYMELIKRSSASVRRELLANRKIFSGWFGKLGQEDNEQIVMDTFDLMRERVLKDNVVFTKSAKMGLFNDWTLKNIQRILSSSQVSELLVEKICRFVITLLCDRNYGVRLPGENRLALSFLKIVKPWENKAQMDLTMRLLEEMPDIIVPYFDALVVAYPLTPKVSMWWFSFSVLHIRTLKLFMPKLTVLSSMKLEELAKWILPATVSRQALQQAVAFKDSPLIQFQAAQIVLFALRRLGSSLKLVSSSPVIDVNALTDLVLARLPEAQSFTGSAEQDLLRTTHLMILKEFCQLRPQSLSINIPLEAREVSGLKLIQSEQILEVQTYTSDQTKWWNSGKEGSSLFLQLVKFSTFNLSLEAKSSKLLQHLVEPTQLFAEVPTLAHPIDALLFTLSAYFQIVETLDEIVWELLEQTVQRTIRSPYQYIDQIKSGSVSPFLVALVEQYTQYFSKRDAPQISLGFWVRNFARSLLVLGEDREIITSLMERVDSVSPEFATQASEEYFDFVLDESDSAILERRDLIFKINNKLELAATLYRASTSPNAEVRIHLLANIPAIFLDVLASSPPAFMPFLSGSDALATAFISALDGRSSEALSSAMENSKWKHGISLVSTEFLLDQLLLAEEKSLAKSILSELNRRKHVLPTSYLESKLEVPGIAQNLDLRAPFSLDPEVGLSLMRKSQGDALLVASLVRVSGSYGASLELSTDHRVLVAAAKYARDQVDTSGALDLAHELLRKPGSETAGVSVTTQFIETLDAGREDLKQKLWTACSDYIESARHGLQKSVLTEDFLKLLPLNPPFLARWVKVAVHQITLRCAEHKYDEEARQFVRHLASSTDFFKLLWTHVHPNAVNSLIEAAMREQRSPETYELVTKIALKESDLAAQSKGSSKLTVLAHLLIIFENTKPNECTVELALVIYSLFMADPAASSSLEVEQCVLVRYDGSPSPKDRILLQLLEKIEAQRQRSWVDHVVSWEVRPALSSAAQHIDDYGLDPMIMLKGDTSVFVTIDEQRVFASINAWEGEFQWGIKPGIFNFEEIVSSVELYSLQLPDSCSQLYDPSFLLGCLTSCDQLMQNLETVLNSGLLSFVICCLANKSHQDTAARLLKLVFKLLADTQLKDQVGMRLLLGKILMLLSDLQEKGLEIPSHIPPMIGQMALVISRPNHFMSEKIYKWLLSGPKIQDFEVPMFKTILESQSDFKVRELLWLMNLIRAGAVDCASVQLFARNGIIEWALSQVGLLNIKSKSVKDAATKLVERIEEVRGGASVLVTTSGALAMPALNERILQAADPEIIRSWIQGEVEN